jgi:hypothetical protein
MERRAPGMGASLLGRSFMPRIASALLGLTVLLSAAAPSRALFHISVISEIMSGVGADTSLQFVEVEMKFGSQNFVKNARLTAFSCDGRTATPLLLVPSDVASSGLGVRWIAATASFAAAAGNTPDFTLAAGIDAHCGMVCWGAPVGSDFKPVDPSTWDLSDPTKYVDCVAYGPYTGTLGTHSGMPTPLTPGDGVHSLTRQTDTDDNQADFALACPTPTNDAGATGALGSCRSMTTSTTLPPVGCVDPAAAATVQAEVDAQCNCAGVTSHARYVRCAAGLVAGAAKQRALPRACKGKLVSCAASSTCGRPGFVTCCRTTARGKHTCAIKRSAAACKAPKGGRACVGDHPSCCDACATCASSGGPVGTTSTTIRRTTRPTTPPPGY